MKNFLKLIPILTIYLSCAAPQFEQVSFCDFFTQTQQIATPDSIGLSDFIYFAKYIDPNRVMLTEMFSRSMFILDYASESIKKQLQNGLGPGEYIMAYDFQVHQDTLFFNDKSSSRLQFVDLSSMQASQLFPIANPTHCSFAKHHGDFYFLNWGRGHTHYLHDFHGNGFFEVPKLFQTIPSPMLPLKIVTLNDKLYFVNRFENKIFELDLLTKAERIIHVQGLPLENWENALNTEMPQSTFMERLEKKPVIVLFDIIIINQTPHFLITFPPHGTSPSYLYVVTLDGKITHQIDTRQYFPISAGHNKVTTYSMQEDTFYLTEFMVRKTLKNSTLTP